MRTKVRIVIVADIDLDEWRREYGQPEVTATQIKNAVREDIAEHARETYPVSTFGSMVLVSQAVR
jgi:hypothetical protein